MSAADIEAVLGMRVEMHVPMGHPGEGSRGAAGAALDSPGMLARHYAPGTPARLFGLEDWPRVLREDGGSRAVVVARSDLHAPAPHIVLAMPETAEAYAAVLYARLREADAMGAERMLIERLPAGVGGADAALWEAITDRLQRATAE